MNGEVGASARESKPRAYVSTSTPPSFPLTWRLAAGAALIAALALLAIVVAHWGWKWFGPTPVSIPPVIAPGDPVQRIADARLFGAATPAPKNAPAAPTGDLRLLGIFAERDGKGFALFRAGTRGPLLIASGTEIAPGVKLETVRIASVTLIDNGVRREIALRPPPGERAKSSSLSGAPKSASCVAPAGFSGPVVRLNAELLSGMINSPETWKGLVQSATGALVVRDQSGFAGMMSLKNGDRIERANGIALVIPDDVASAVLKPLTASQPVWVSGTRDGKPQQWLYLNAGACPA